MEGRTLKGVGVDHVDQVGHLAGQHERADVTQLLGELPGKAHEVVPANGHDLGREGVVVVEDVALGVVRHQLL